MSAVLSAFGLVLAPIAILASRGVVPLLLVATLLAAVAMWSAERRMPRPDRAMSVLFFLLVLWCAAASLWSPAVTQSLVLALRIGVLFAAGLMLFAMTQKLAEAGRERAGHWILIGFALGLLILGIEVMFDLPIVRLLGPEPGPGEALAARLNRGATAMAMLAWPAAALLWRRGLPWGALALIGLTGAILSGLTSVAALLGLCAGAATAAVALVSWRTARALIAAATVVALTAMPLIAQDLQDRGWQQAAWLPTTAQQRVQIWKFTSDHIARKPFFGWGFDAAREISRSRPVDPDSGRRLLPLHPHNAPLQILLELGAVGTAIALLLTLAVLRRLSALPRRARVCGYALYMSTLAIASTAYGLWQNQWLAMMFAAAVLMPLTCGKGCADTATGGSSGG